MHNSTLTQLRALFSTSTHHCYQYYYCHCCPTVAGGARYTPRHNKFPWYARWRIVYPALGPRHAMKCLLLPDHSDLIYSPDHLFYWHLVNSSSSSSSKGCLSQKVHASASQVFRGASRGGYKARSSPNRAFWGQSTHRTHRWRLLTLARHPRSKVPGFSALLEFRMECTPS